MQRVLSRSSVFIASWVGWQILLVSLSSAWLLSSKVAAEAATNNADTDLIAAVASLSLNIETANFSSSTSDNIHEVVAPHFLRLVSKNSSTGSSSSIVNVPTHLNALEECDEKCCQQFVSSECRNNNNTITGEVVGQVTHKQENANFSSVDSNGYDANDANNNESAESAFSLVNVLPFPVQIFLIIILISLSALFSGLTLGLMGLNKTGLEIVMEGDDVANAKAASIIYPVRKDGNLLLCTLLLGNVAVNALLSILMADLSSGLVGFLLSTILIVIFGEIIPQAFCSRFALLIGSKTVPLVRVIIYLLYIFARPLAFCLDKVLGDELATTYSSSEMLKLLHIHVQENALDKETAVAMEGALKYKDLKVSEVMTPVDKAFMLSIDEKLNFETIARIFKTGYSRIPIYEVSKNNVTGLLFVKDLIFIDPEDETPIRNFIQIFGRTLHTVWHDDKLGGVLRDLKQGRSHMALVRDVNNQDENQDPYYELTGIITLEDIIEEILGQEIVDETDAFVDATETVRVNREQGGFEWARLRLLDTKIVDEKLTYDEARAVSAHLNTNYPIIGNLLTDAQLLQMVSETNVTVLPEAVRKIGEEVRGPKQLFYERNHPTEYCTLILSGKATVRAGRDAFLSDVSSWAVLAPSALADDTFEPDYDAYVSAGPLRCLRFTRSQLRNAKTVSEDENDCAEGNVLAIEEVVPSKLQEASSSSDGRVSRNNGIMEPLDIEK